MITTQNRKIRGAAGIEFALLLPLWTIMLLGVFWFGNAMIRAMQVNQIARDVASMYARNQDFSAAVGATDPVANPTYGILKNIASPIGSLDPTSGTGVIIFSQFIYAGDNTCQLAGTSPIQYFQSAGAPGTHCVLGNAVNGQQWVFTQRYVVGKTSLHASMWGTPPTSEIVVGTTPGPFYMIPMINSSNPSTKGYLINTADRLSRFNLLPTPKQDGTDGYQSNQTVYAVEVFFSSIVGSQFQGGNYAYALF